MASLELQRHNKTVLDNLEPGDLLEIKRQLFNHWAVYVGKKEVVHLSGVDGQMGSNLGHLCSVSGVEFDKGIIRKDAFWDVVGDSKVDKKNSKDTELKPFEPPEIVQRALFRLGEVGYNVLYKNCEHFASWCRYGKEESDQVKGLLIAVAAVVWCVAVVVAGLA